MPKARLVYWKPGLAVRGKSVYLDANFIVALGRPEHIWHASARELRAHLVERGIKLVLSSLALNEAIYQLIRLSEKDDTDDKALFSRLDEEILQLPNLQPFDKVTPDFHRTTLKAIADLKLDPTDAYHYTAARWLSCPIITNDVGFQKINDAQLTVITFFSPTLPATSAAAHPEQSEQAGSELEAE